MFERNSDMLSFEGIPILKAVAFSSGDGWKDTTVQGESAFVWGLLAAPPYVGNSLPIMGCCHTSLNYKSPDHFYFRKLTSSEMWQLQALKPDLVAEVQLLKESIVNGSLVQISSLPVFLKRLANPKVENNIAWKNKYERFGLGDYYKNNFADPRHNENKIYLGGGLL